MVNENTEQAPIYSISQETVPIPKPRSSLIKIILGIVIASIVGGGGSLATRIWDPLWNPFRPDPEKIIEEMSVKMQEVKTFHTDIDLEMAIENESNFLMKISSWADTDSTNPENLKSVTGLNLNFTFEGTQFTLGLETKQLGETSYFRLTNIPTALLGGMGVDISQMKDVWIKSDKDSFDVFKELLGEEAGQKMQEETEKSENQQKEVAAKLKELLESKKFYSIAKEFPDEEINNIKVHHYLVALNKEEIKNILPDLLKIFGGKEDQSILSGQIEGLEKELEKFLEGVGDLEGELWIGKRDNLLYRFKGEKSVELSQFREGVKGTFSLKIDIHLSRLNQPVQVEAPQDFKTLKEIFSLSFGTAFLEAGQKAKDASIKGRMSQISTIAEVIYFDNKDSYAGMSCQHKELNQACDDVLKDAGQKPTIYSSPKHYCVYIKLGSKKEISGKGLYYCIDDSFKSVQTTIFPGGKGYCDGKTFICPAATK